MDEPPVSVVFNGVRYTRNPDAEQRSHRVYYLETSGRKREYLHRAVWRAANPGRTIPKGWHVHHIDHDPFNNAPSNLEAISTVDHGARHAGECSDSERENLERIRPLASAWHGSPEGIEWHREHGKRSWDNREYRTLTCECCGVEYQTRKAGEHARFCSRTCGNRVNDQSHRYQVQVPCPVCGTEFWQSKYRPKPESCSNKCGSQIRRARAA